VFINNKTEGQASLSLGQDNSTFTRTLGLFLSETWWVNGRRSSQPPLNPVAS